MIPLVLIILIVVVVFLVGGKEMGMTVLNTARSQGQAVMTNVATQAAGKLLKRD